MLFTNFSAGSQGSEATMKKFRPRLRKGRGSVNLSFGSGCVLTGFFFLDNDLFFDHAIRIRCMKTCYEAETVKNLPSLQKVPLVWHNSTARKAIATSRDDAF